MKKYKNFIITLIISMICGGIVGFVSGTNIDINLDFGKNLYVYLFKGFLGLEIFLAIVVIFSLIFLTKKLKNINLEDIPKSIDKFMTLFIHLTTISVIVSITFLSTMISKSYRVDNHIYIMIATLSIIFTSILQVLSIRCFNRYYPDRTLNMFEDNSDKKYFQKLDEGEKWIVYISSYKSFKVMQSVYSAFMVIIIVLSAVMTVPIILPIIIALLWIIQISIYILESSKYN